MAFKANPEKHGGIDGREQISAELHEQDHPSAKSLTSPALWQTSPGLWSSRVQ